jgi:hypothetical protein
MENQGLAVEEIEKFSGERARAYSPSAPRTRPKSAPKAAAVQNDRTDANAKALINFMDSLREEELMKEKRAEIKRRWR